jgi:hypothetical protein
MHEKHSDRSEKPKNTFIDPLTFLLEEGDELLGEGEGVETAKLLYDAACKLTPEGVTQLFGRAGSTKSLQLWDYFNDVMRYIPVNGYEVSRGDYTISLAYILECFDDLADISICKNAVRLASEIEAWELADHIGTVQGTIAPWLYEEESRELCQPLVNEVSRFFENMEAAAPVDSNARKIGKDALDLSIYYEAFADHASDDQADGINAALSPSATTNSVERSNSHDDDKLDAYREFIESLDLDDFDRRIG